MTRHRATRWLLAASLAACQPVGAPVPLSLVGAWEGAVTVRGRAESLQVMFTADSPAVAGTVSIPGRYALDYPLVDPVRAGPVVRFALPDLLEPGRFEGRLERGRFVGAFTGFQFGDSLSGRFELWRRPLGRRPYRVEAVGFSGGEGRLAGSLYLPPDAGRHPAVVLLHGSGPQTRDSYLRFFADRLARAGVAALIYDKRGTGSSEGTRWPRGSATLADLAGDGLAAVRFLAARADIDGNRIGLWGLSQGAWLAPLAAVRDPQVSFVVLVSGGGVTPAEQEIYDDQVKLTALGYTEGEVGEAVALLRLGDEFIREGSDANWERLQAALGRARGQRWFRDLDRFPMVLPREAWWHGGELDYDPRETLRRLRIPALVILGENDYSTPAHETVRRIEAAFREGDHKNHRVIMVPSADHALQVGPDPWATTRRIRSGRGPVEGEWDWLRPAPGWVEAMVSWIVAQVRAS